MPLKLSEVTDLVETEDYQRFEKLANMIISPKSELDKREADYQREKKAAKKRKAA